MQQPNDDAIGRLKAALARGMVLNRLESSAAAQLYDFSSATTYGAGLLLAEICLGTAADVRLAANPLPTPGIKHAIEVQTETPLLACLGCQYAGWPVTAEGFFAMASGPMRLNRGREEMLQKYFEPGESPAVIGVLETGQVPDAAVLQPMASACQVSPDQLYLCIAPTESLAGTMQIVSRSIEASLHKLYELGFDLRRIRRGWGRAPLPPHDCDFLTAIGRTNDAILYGAEVRLWVDAPEDELRQLAQALPSNSSVDYGKPFREIFESYGRDFYAIDKQLFSAAAIDLISLVDDGQVTCGELRPDLLETSFGS